MKRLIYSSLILIVALIVALGFTVSALKTAQASTNQAALQNGEREQLVGYTQIDTGFRSIEPGYYLKAQCPGNPKLFATSEVVVGGGATVGSNQSEKVGRALVTSRPDGFYGWIAAYEGKPSKLRIVLICVKQFLQIPASDPDAGGITQ